MVANVRHCVLLFGKLLFGEHAHVRSSELDSSSDDLSCPVLRRGLAYPTQRAGRAERGREQRGKPGGDFSRRRGGYVTLYLPGVRFDALIPKYEQVFRHLARVCCHASTRHAHAPCTRCIEESRRGRQFSSSQLIFLWSFQGESLGWVPSGFGCQQTYAYESW